MMNPHDRKSIPLLLGLLFMLLLAAPAGAAEKGTAKLGQDQLITRLPADTLVGAGLAATAQSGVVVTLPLRAFQKADGSLWLEYPEVWPQSGEPIYLNLQTGVAAGAAQTGIEFSSTIVTPITSLIGSYSGPLKLDVKGSKSFITIKGTVSLSCKLVIKEIKPIAKSNNYTIKGSFTYSGKIKVAGKETKIGSKTIDFNNSTKMPLIPSGADYSFEFNQKVSDYTLDMKVTLNGESAVGKVNVSGKTSGIKITGNGQFSWDK